MREIYDENVNHQQDLERLDDLISYQQGIAALFETVGRIGNLNNDEEVILGIEVIKVYYGLYDNRYKGPKLTSLELDIPLWKVLSLHQKMIKLMRHCKYVLSD